MTPQTRHFQYTEEEVRKLSGRHVCEVVYFCCRLLLDQGLITREKYDALMEIFREIDVDLAPTSDTGE